MGNYRDLMPDRGPGRLSTSQEHGYAPRQVGACRSFCRYCRSCRLLPDSVRLSLCCPGAVLAEKFCELPALKATHVNRSGAKVNTRTQMTRSTV